MLDGVSRHLNDVHGVRHSRRYWSILLFRYLNKCGEAIRAGLPVDDAPASPPDEDAILGMKEGDGAAPARRAGLLQRVGHRLASLPRSPRAVRERASIKRLHDANADSARSLLYGFHYYHRIAEMVEQPAAMLLAPRLKNPAANPAKRNALREVERAEPSPNVRTALRWLPRDYVEEFSAREAAVPIRNPAQSYHAGFLTAVEARMRIAAHVELGAGLSIYQHAATYGEVEDDVAYHAESGFADRFFTWGWKIGPRDVPYVGLRLLKPAEEEIRPRGDATQWVYLCVRYPYPWLLRDALDTQDRFFEKLSPAHTRRVSVRPKALKGGSAERQMSALARKGGATLDDGMASWSTLANRAALVVVDSFPTTVFQECVLAGIAIIGLVPRATRYTEVARPFYEQFERVGVLHRDPAAAAAFLNDTNLTDWWASVRQQDWFGEYIRTFCRTTINDAH